MKYRNVFCSLLLAVVWLIGCSNPIGTTTKPIDPTVDPVVGFNVTGKILDKYGKPVAGAMATLLNARLSDVTDENGEYVIKGSGRILKSLAKMVMVADADTPTVEGTDTLIVTIASPDNPDDSSEVIKTVVKSGVIMELPTTFIVQREIAVPYVVENGTQIGRVEATVYDVSVPDVKKIIDLANDVTRKAFTTFAYFSSEQNKKYILYTMVYDVQGKFIGRSSDYPFNDSYGDLEYSTPFRCNNAAPNLGMIAPETVYIKINSNAIITVNAIDSFGGEIVSCKVTVNGIPLSTNNIDTGKMLIPMKDNNYAEVIAIAKDNDGNITTVKQEITVSNDTMYLVSPIFENTFECFILPDEPFLKDITLTQWEINGIKINSLKHDKCKIQWIPTVIPDTINYKVTFILSNQEYVLTRMKLKPISGL